MTTNETDATDATPTGASAPAQAPGLSRRGLIGLAAGVGAAGLALGAGAGSAAGVAVGRARAGAAEASVAV